MATLPERPWGRYLAALAAVLLAFLVREGISFAAGPDFSEYVIFYPAVMIVALFAGLGPGIFTAVASSILLLGLATLPWRLLPFSSRTGNFVSMGFFTIVCIFLAVIADLYRRSRVKAAAYDKEQALRASQEELRRQAELLRLSFDAIIVWTMGGGIESWNRGAEELYGYSEEEARGRDVHTLLRTRHAVPWEEFETMLRAAGQWNGELAHVTRGGAEVIVSSRLHIGHDADGRMRVLQIDRDITAQKMAQRDLQRARDELEEKVQDRTADLKKANRNLLMVSACDQALVQMSDERELVAVICHIIQEEGGYPLVWVGMAGAVTITPFRWVASAGDRTGFLDSLRDRAGDGLTDGPAGKALLTGEPVVVEDLATEDARPWREEALRRGYRGAAAFPLLGTPGAAFGVLMIYSDASPSFERGNLSLLGELVNDLAFGVLSLRAREERDQAQLALESQAGQLRILAGELVRTEQRERRRIAQLLHDQLQQHLAAALYGLNELKAPAPPPEHAGAVERLGTLLRESISMSRSLTSELGHPALMEPDISVGLEWLAAWMKEKHGLAVSVEAPSPTTLPAEDVRITLLQAVRELLFNVVKHAGTSRARVTVDRSRPDRMGITVSDDGAGFDAARVAPLRQAGAGGIGLFSLRERLALSGGGIEVASAPGKGSRVTAWVPVSAIEEAAPPPAPAAAPKGGVRPAPGPGARIRLLLADDHVVVRDGMVLQLEKQPDIEVVGVAADGEHAVAMAAELLPDVVTMDVDMPGMGGIEATRRIHSRHPRIAVIGVSMYDDATHAAAMRGAGAVAHLSKSASLEELLEAIRFARVSAAADAPALS